MNIQRRCTPFMHRRCFYWVYDYINFCSFNPKKGEAQMKLHVRTCTGCKRVGVRIHDDDKWLPWRNGAINEQVRMAHDIVSETEFECSECKTAGMTHHIACTAGAVH